MNLALNSHNGHLSLPGPGTITPALRPGNLGTLAAAHPPAYRDMGNGWVWYDLQLEQPPLHLGLCLNFQGSRLRSCLFGLPTEQPRTRAAYNEARERRLALEYDAWLTGQIGRCRTFNWGEAWAGYDPRNGTGGLRLRYAVA